MSRLARMLNAVPGWLYSLVIVALLFLCLWLKTSQSVARVDAADARTELATTTAAAAASAASSVQAARGKEQVMNNNQTKVNDELQSGRDERDQRIAALLGQLREQARAGARTGGGRISACAQAAGGGDGLGDPGLREVAGGDRLVLDGQAQEELATFAVRARETGDTLKACRVLLRQAWQVTNELPQTP